MGFLDIIRGWVYKRVLSQSAKHKTFDIIEVRTKELTLTYVNMETDVRIENSFFLPITILSIETDIVNAAGTRVGKMSYREPKRLKGHASEIFTTRSKMSNITAFFHALQHLLSMSVTMRSVGTAKIKFLWWVFEIPVDDTFEVKPSQVKLTEELSEAEKQQRAERRKKEQEEREQRRAERMKPKEKSKKPEGTDLGSPTPVPLEENTMTVSLNEDAILDIPLEITNEPTIQADPDEKKDELQPEDEETK
jgi:hypothetical protein